MPLTKQPININFAQGLDTKSDSKQVQVGKFLELQNSVFDKQGALTKRNGFPIITKLPNTQQTNLTTLNNNLIATGSNLYAFSADTNQWLNQGLVQPVKISTQALVRNSTSQSAPDMQVAFNGLACTVYLDNGFVYYQISDSATGQTVVGRALASTFPAASAKVFILGNYFMVTFISNIGGVLHLQYIPIPITLPTAPLITQDFSVQVPASAGYDAVLGFNGNLYISYATVSNQIFTTYITPSLVLQASFPLAGATATLISMSSDSINNVIYTTYYDSVSKIGGIVGYNLLLNTTILPATIIISGSTLAQITSVASAGLVTIMYETVNTYSYAPNAKSDFISSLTITQTGVITPTVVILRSVGLFSKAFIDKSGLIYMIVTYGGPNEPTYFLIDSNGNIFARLAYANGGGYNTTQVLANVTSLNGSFYTPYLIKDFLASVNKLTNLPNGTPVNGIYTQTGINLVKFQINSNTQRSSEIAATLHLTGGQLWQYDGNKPVEHGFHVWPENVALATSATGGNITAGTYYYAFTYEWTDNQGNLHRSAPSIPSSIVTTGATSSITINVPTLRLTYKTGVRIVGYRWSVAQQTYYQFTPLTSPIINDPTIDSVTITDTLADSAILGQTLLYTTGGVLEDIAAPASTSSTLFKNRLFLIDAEDQNLLWFSKQVIQAVPVEMSDLLTIYVAPTSGAQGSTGPMKALSAMDDKLIIFKKDAIYYITGTGPDNTGANSDFSDPIFITSSVGSANPNSVVLMPNGIMFQSDKGIWLLGRDLQTTYIGAPVDKYNKRTVTSALSIPGTNQVRFALDNSITLVFDYFYQQWGTFSNVGSISSVLFNGKDTYLNNLGFVYQETPGVYLDGSTPVLLSFTTGWISLAGIQGLERFYFLYLEGTYITPFKLQVQIAYDYNPGPQQSNIMIPDNYVPSYGGEALWGSGGSYGGSNIKVTNILEMRLFPQVQKCETFQLVVNEIYDNSFNIPAGEGLTLSGINVIVGTKRGYRAQKANQSFG